jgi:hypothetical protein
MTNGIKAARFRRDSSKYGKRHTPGQMNQTEAAYAESLQALKLTGEILDWKFEAVTFKIAKDTRYTPDFMVMYADCTVELVDCKGGGPINPTSLVKVKCAAEMFWMFNFVIEKRLPKKAGWKRTEY